MTRLTRNERRLVAADQAAHWLIALQAGELSPQLNSEFIDWLRDSPLHVSEMLQACRLHRDLAAFDRWNNIIAFEGRAQNQVLTLLPRDRVAAKPSAPRRRRHVFAIAACLAVTVLASPYLLHRLGESDWKTDAGERREVTLSDDSVMDLAPSSEVRVRFQGNSRTIWLKRGEALFHVAKDPNRPFVVQVGNTRVRAVGTVFNVAEYDQDISVTVVEGRVAVSAAGFANATDASAHLTPLGADEQMVISAVDHSSKVLKVRGDVEVAWAAGQLVFENEQVAEIVRRFNRYNKIQLRLADERLGERRMSGMFRVTDPESFVAVLQAAGDVAVNRSSRGVIIVGVSGTAESIPP